MRRSGTRSYNRLCYSESTGGMNEIMEAQIDEAVASPPAGAVLETIPLPFEPLPALKSSIGSDEGDLANCRGKRIGILIVTYNAVTTLTHVLKRITPQVWANIEEIAVFDDASQDSTYELALGLKSLRALPKLTVMKHERNLGYGGNQK